MEWLGISWVDEPASVVFDECASVYRPLRVYLGEKAAD